MLLTLTRWRVKALKSLTVPFFLGAGGDLRLVLEQFIEPLYGYEREVPLPVANRNLAMFAAWLERRAAPELRVAPVVVGRQALLDPPEAARAQPLGESQRVLEVERHPAVVGEEEVVADAPAHLGGRLEVPAEARFALRGAVAER